MVASLITHENIQQFIHNCTSHFLKTAMLTVHCIVVNSDVWELYTSCIFRAFGGEVRTLTLLTGVILEMSELSSKPIYLPNTANHF